MLKIVLLVTFGVLLVVCIILLRDRFTAKPTQEIVDQSLYERKVLTEIVETGYTISLYGVSNYRTDVNQLDPALYNKTSFVRVTNTSDSPIVITHPSGSTIGWAFKASSIVDANNPHIEAELPSHPIDAAAVSTTNATIAPGSYFDVKGDPHHITHAISFIQRSSVPITEVLITYSINFSIEQAGETTKVSKTMAAPMTITLRNNTLL
ncbi:MAG: hypothetical protein RLZZ70_547 [Candidatus Parcubacteria bacterium]